MAIEMYCLTPIGDESWKRGYTNLFDAELGSWFKTRRWVNHSLIWLFAIDFILILTTLGSSTGKASALDTWFLYSIFSSIWTIFGCIVVASSTVVGEKNNGIASWILSKPVSRKMYLLSKYVSIAIGMLITMVVIPGVFTYLFIGLWSGYWINPLNFVAALGVIYISLMFFMSFTFMLGTYLSKQNQVIGGGIMMIFIILNLAGLIPYSSWFIPMNVSIPYNNSSSVVYGLLSSSYQSLYPVLLCVIYISLFVLLSIRRFEKEDL